MKPPFRAVVAMVFATLLAGALGGLAGVVYGGQLTRPHAGLDAVIHQELDLTAVQNQRIEALEDKFAERQDTIRGDMRAANRELADALEAEHTYGPRAQIAMGRFHKAEEQLQVASIRHVLAMRAVLNPGQSRKLDHAIYAALTAGS